MRRVLLWDVDGTLVRTGGAGRDVFETALAVALDRDLVPRVVEQVVMSGKTDPQIAREILLLAEVADDEVERHLPLVLSELERALADSGDRIRKEGLVLPGVEALLERFSRDGAVLQTLVTGNLAANAAVKVGAFSLEHHFDFDVGAYGSDSADRRELVPIALERIERHRGFVPDPRTTWVIGDTPRDLECARAGGVRCLLVATGRVPLEELESLGADACRPDLADTGAVARLLAA